MSLNTAITPEQQVNLPSLRARSGKKHRLLEMRSCSSRVVKPVRTLERAVPTNHFNTHDKPSARKWIFAMREHWAEAIVVTYDRWYDEVAREVRTDVIETSVYTSWRALPGFEDRDICAYCGCDTTNARMGFDCVQCGGN